jgi:glycosyltransferase involved in cell wall biosynthesis
MNILVLVEDWMSFYVQAQALTCGFVKLGITSSMLTITTQEGVRADIDDLSNETKLLLSNKELRKKMGRSAYEYTHKNFASQVIAKRFLDEI